MIINEDMVLYGIATAAAIYYVKFSIESYVSNRLDTYYDILSADLNQKGIVFEKPMMDNIWSLYGKGIGIECTPIKMYILIKKYLKTGKLPMEKPKTLKDF